MSEQILPVDLEGINARIADRSDVFYWQTDRAIDPIDAGKVWADRHRYFTNNEIIDAVNNELSDNTLVSIEPFEESSQTNLGNVNSVRTGLLSSGDSVIIRCHPRGIKNGYFYAETAASSKAKEAGLPTYETITVHEFSGGSDFAFQVIQKLQGTAIKKWLETNPDDESSLLRSVGATMAQLHKINVDGFGPFNNEKAKSGELVGLHKSLAESMRAGLAFNMDILKQENIFTENQVLAIETMFTDDNLLLKSSGAVLVHNDFADWNLLTDGHKVTGILDWDEAVASDPIADIACWSTFFEPKRIEHFLAGYWSVTDKPADFEEKFELFRLRYTISKMTLRIRRYSWEPSDLIKDKIETGKVHLLESMKYFGI